MSGAGTVGEFLSALGAVVPFAKAAGWDPVGLQIGDPDSVVSTVAVCHEVTGDVIASVRGDPVDLLVSYHPLLFHAVLRLVAGSDASGRALQLASAGIALAVAHTAYDVAPGGAADALADALSLEDPSGFGPLWGGDSAKIVTFVPEEQAERVIDAMAAAGAGTVGDYTGCAYRSPGTGMFRAAPHAAPVVGRPGERSTVPESRVEMVVPLGMVDAVAAALVAAHPYEEPAFDVYERRGDAGFVGRIGSVSPPTNGAALASSVSARLGGNVRLAGDPHASVARVAVVPGSGGDLLAAAAAAGAAAVVTGDVSHHQAAAAVARGTVVIDPGHVATERPGLERLYAAVAEIAGGARDLRHLDADPWRPAG